MVTLSAGRHSGLPLRHLYIPFVTYEWFFAPGVLKFSQMRPFIHWIFALVLWSVSVSAQTTIPEIHSYLSQISNRGQFNGVVLVAQKGSVIYSHSFGYANLETKRE